MIRDHRPYGLKKAWLSFEKFYVRHFLSPQFESIGKEWTFMKPWHVELFGRPIHLGNYVNVIATPDRKVRLSVWSNNENSGGIRIGDYALICPGVRIGAADYVEIGANSMLATNVYITDSDWHDIYDRTSFGKSSPVILKENVWVGDGAIVCKGVTIGENSIIGAGSVVLKDVPANVIAAGNPAKTVKTLDPDKELVTRSSWFDRDISLKHEIEAMDRYMLKNNTTAGWLRSLFFPAKGD